MDKASLLGDAVAFIQELRSKVEKLELEKIATAEKPSGTCCEEILRDNDADDNIDPRSSSLILKEVRPGGVVPCPDHKLDMTVYFLPSCKALIRVESPDHDHPAARVMMALRDLQLEVHHSSISSRKNSRLHQSIIVNLKDGKLRSEEELAMAVSTRARVYCTCKRCPCL